MEGIDRINNICTKVPEFLELYNARVRHYVGKEHIVNVFNQFEKYFSNYFIKSKLEEFRLFLLLHDIGKSLAYKEGNINNQHNYTISEIQKHKYELGISDEDLKFYNALLCASSIGKYMINKASLVETFNEIAKQSKNSNLPIIDFFYFLSVYYQCDVASYTKDAGGFAYLEHIFEYQNGFKIYSTENNLLIFKDLYAKKYSLLFNRIYESSKISNQPEYKKENTLSSQDIHVKIVDTIDLSIFEKPKKEIIEGKKNIYIIDTNVFVDHPEIISKIDNKYSIVLSAKVIDELDYLKVSLTEEQKKNVQRALRQINECINKRGIKMDVADLSLLPNDFNKRSPDNFILSVALKYKGENPIMLTSDNGLQIKAKGLGVTTISLKAFLNQLKY
jgi:rRNA-processing protein FCF1